MANPSLSARSYAQRALLPLKTESPAGDQVFSHLSVGDISHLDCDSFKNLCPSVLLSSVGLWSGKFCLEKLCFGSSPLEPQLYQCECLQGRKVHRDLKMCCVICCWVPWNPVIDVCGHVYVRMCMCACTFVCVWCVHVCVVWMPVYRYVYTCTCACSMCVSTCMGICAWAHACVVCVYIVYVHVCSLCVHVYSMYVHVCSVYVSVCGLCACVCVCVGIFG